MFGHRFRIVFFFFRRTFFKEKLGRVKKSGEIYYLPKLAETMEILAKEGADAMYKGSLTLKLIDDLKRINSIISEKDLANYE